MKELNLSEYRYDHFSQGGEDCVIEKLFELIGAGDGYLVEAGAWDGRHFSNTYYHHSKPGSKFKTVLIEEDTHRFQDLLRNVPQNENNILLNLTLCPIGDRSLNSIFENNNVTNIDLLSLDCDGGEDVLFKTLNTTKYRPKIVIIEMGEWKSRAALDSMVGLFKNKGYNLIHVTGNFIFIDDQFGISAKENIYGLMRNSGHSEYLHHFGLITGDEMENRHQDLHKNLHSQWAGPQIILISEK